MSSIIAEKYANLLTVEDVIQLFESLEKIIGNKADAAKICGLERKTIYGWKKTGEIRLRTKRKLLVALIENLTEETLDFITERSVETAVGILRTYVTAVYEKAMDEGISTTEFMRLASKFEDARKRYAGLIVDNIETEVGNMAQFIAEKARDLDVSFKPSPFNIVRLSEFSVFLPSLIKTVSTLSPYTSPTEIAEIFNLSPQFVQTLSKALHENYVAIRIPSFSVETVLPHERRYLAASTIESRMEVGKIRQEDTLLTTQILGGTT